jgi:LPS-assembly lipoprotein
MRGVTRMLMVAGLGLLAGCGFQLRGQANLPFEAAYVNAAPNSTLAVLLAKQLELRGKWAKQRSQADVVITLADETRAKTILTLSGAGKVQEFRLTHKVTVSASDAAGHEVLAPTTSQQTRDFSYSPSQVLASDAFEASLNNDMDQDTVQQIVRRLSFIHKP